MILRMSGEEATTTGARGQRNDEGEALWFFGGLTVIKGDGSAYVVTEQLFPRGVETPLHVQPEDDETYYVADGEATFFAGDRRERASAGFVVHVPKGTPHGFRVESETLRIVNVTTTQHAAFFRAVGDPAPQLTIPPPGEPDMERIMAAAREYNIELVGPLPA